jgi:hypothetical protein
MRNLIDFDYNPKAEIALKAFGEVSMKQFKEMNISTHIGGLI